MIHQQYFPIQEYETSTEKNEYVYLHKKDNQMKNDNINVEKVGIVENGKDFINCKIIHDRDST